MSDDEFEFDSLSDFEEKEQPAPPVKAPVLPPVQIPTSPSVQIPTIPPVQIPTVPPVQIPSLPPTHAPSFPPVQLPTNPLINNGPVSAMELLAKKKSLNTSNATVSTSTSSSENPTPPVQLRPSGLGSGNSIVVNICQKGNPAMNYLTQVPWEYGDIVADYQVGATTGCLFLSLRYHLLHPQYIHGRLSKMSKSFTLRILIVSCDAENYNSPIRELTRICLTMGFTIIVSWSAQETAQYLQLYKALERAPPDMIKEKINQDYMSRMTNVMTTIKSVNRTDVVTFASKYGSFKSLVQASLDSLEGNTGLGEKKAKRIRECFAGKFVLGNEKEDSGRSKKRRS